MTKPRPDSARLNAATRKLFLAHLSETANISASARFAGISARAVYAERRRSPAFRGEWAQALVEGYARLETELLAEALQAANGKTSDATLKARAQKQRLGVSLLNWHKSSVKAAPAAATATIAKEDLPVLKAQLILKLTQMRDRAGVPLEGLNDGSALPAQDAA
jgi:hypothetical protein